MNQIECPMLKWLLRIVGLLLIVLLGAVVYVEMNKDELVRRGIEEVNRQMKGSIDYEKSDVSLLRRFPRVSLILHDVEVRDSLQVEDVPFFEAGKVGVGVDLISILKKQYEVTFFEVSNADVYLAKYGDGTTNYAVARDQGDSRASAAFDASIKNYNIDNLNIRYSDHQTHSDFK
ncbi:MAG: hypothetical protein AAFR14_12100, partial [Bacteroidota bacterium]